MKTGYKTTEFWGKILAQLGAVAAALAGTLEPQTAAIVVAISEAAYALSRGFTKGGTGPTGDPQ